MSLINCTSGLQLTSQGPLLQRRRVGWRRRQFKSIASRYPASSMTCMVLPRPPERLPLTRRDFSRSSVKHVTVVPRDNHGLGVIRPSLRRHSLPRYPSREFRTHFRNLSSNDTPVRTHSLLAWTTSSTSAGPTSRRLAPPLRAGQSRRRALAHSTSFRSRRTRVRRTILAGRPRLSRVHGQGVRPDYREPWALVSAHLLWEPVRPSLRSAATPSAICWVDLAAPRLRART